MEKNLTSKDLLQQNLLWVISLICIFLFSYAAYGKITDHYIFYKGLSKVSFIGPFAWYISWLVPLSEIVVSVLLLFQRTVRIGLYGFLVLMLFFTGYIVSMLLWAEKLPCLCGGVIEKLSWGQHVWFNLVFISLAVNALFLENRKNLKIKKNEKL